MSADTAYEPRIALFGGGGTGFEMYERLFAEVEALWEYVRPEWLGLLIEIGYDQSEIARTRVERRGWAYEILRDPAGIERTVSITIVPCSEK